MIYFDYINHNFSTISEDELELRRLEDKKRKRLARRLALGGLGVNTLGALALEYHGGKEPIDTKVRERLIKNAKLKDPKLKVVSSPTYDNSAYLGLDRSRKKRKKLETLYGKKAVDDVSRRVYGTPDWGKSTVVIGKHPSNAVLAHELGHARGYGDNPNKLVRLAHKLSWNSASKAPLLLTSSAAIAGYKNEMDRLQGKKLSKKKKLLRYAPALAGSVYALPMEAAASINGLYNLKKAGASNKGMMHGTAALGGAYGTYLGNAAIYAGNAVLMDYLGKKLARKRYQTSLEKNGTN